MSSVIETPTGTISPILVTEYSAKRASQSVVHKIMGRTDPDVTLRPAALRTGSLTLLFSTQADAQNGADLLGVLGVSVLSDTDVPGVGMSFIATGDLAVQEDSPNWTLALDFTEVTP